MTSTSAARWPRRAVLAVAVALALAFGPPVAARLEEGRQASPAELKQLSLEQLLEVEVISVVKRPQRWVDTAAALSVITGEDVRRSGARSLPDALRLAPGLHVARFDSRSWAISARGLNTSVANKMLVLIDGRSVYTPLFSGVFWDVQAPLLEDVERIEVVRGPGGALWGANAVNGVINVITRRADDSQGGLLVAGGGDEERPFGAVRWGGTTGGGHYRVYGKLDQHGALALPGGASADDPLRLGQGGFRFDRPLGEATELTLQGDLYEGRIGHRFRDDTDVDGGNLMAHWSRRLDGGSQVALRGYYDHTFRRVPGQFQEDRGTWDVEGQHGLARGRHELLWGGGYRVSEDRVLASPVLAWDPPREAAWVANLFLQDEIDLAPGWQAVLGTKLEEHSTMDLEVMPSLRLAWAPHEAALLWAGAARAVRAPTRLDRDARFLAGGVPFLVGNPDFAPEEVVSYELGGRWAGGARWLLDLAAFHHRYDDLRSTEPGPPGSPLLLANLLAGETAGATLAASWQLVPRARLHGGVTLLDTDLEPKPGGRDVNEGSGEGNDPRRHGFLRLDLDLPADLELGAWLRHVGELPDPVVPAYTELDLRLGWRPRPGLLLGLVGQNLLHDRHPEFGSPATREEVERGVYGQVTWSF
jgi:iron complex outermembrane receptor protein